jgi:hypothetical protein
MCLKVGCLGDCRWWIRIFERSESGTKPKWNGCDRHESKFRIQEINFSDSLCLFILYVMHILEPLEQLHEHNILTEGLK